MSENQLKTYIEGLDFLFGDHIITNNNRNPCILLEGNEGTGKTTLASQIAVNVARETGGISIIFSTEQNPIELKSKVESLNWLTTRKSISLLSGPKMELETKSKTKTEKGYVFLLTAPIDNFSSTHKSICSNIDEIKANFEEYPIKCIVIDSLNAVHGDIPRDEFLILNEKCGEIASLSILVDEGSSKTDRFVFRRYVSDIVIRLGVRYRTDKKEYSERYIEIVKARNQFHYRGKHPFSIVSPKKHAKETGEDVSNVSGGIYVYPSLAARLGEQLREDIPTDGVEEGQEKIRLKFNINTLDQLLYKPDESENQNVLTQSGVIRSSSAVLIGERGTKKAIIGLHFLAEGIAEKQKGLLISLKDDRDAVRTVAKGYKALSDQFFGEMGEKYLQLEHIRPNYMTPGFFLNIVKSWIKNSEKKNIPIKRVVFDNFAQIRLRFPLLNADPMFVPTLIDLFKMHGITSLFIDVVEEPGKAVWEYKSPVLDLADYVIATQHVPFLGRDHTIISVRRSREAKHNAEPAEVRRENDKIVIDTRVLEGMTGVLEKDPKPARIYLKLFYENEAEKQFNDDIVKKLEKEYEEQVHISSFSRGDSSREYDRIMTYGFESARTIVGIVSLDEYWVRYAAKTGKLCKFNKSWFSEEEGEDWLDRETKNYLTRSITAAEFDGDYYGIPNYLDMGLFCYRKDLLEQLNISIKELPHNLNGLIKLIQSNKKEIKEKKLWGFTFDMETEETLVCTFIEFIFNTRIVRERIGEEFYKIINGKVDEPLLQKKNNAVIKKATIEALKEMYKLKKEGIMPYPCTLEHCKDSIFSRQWYSNLQYTCDKWKHLCKSNDEDKARYEKAAFGVMRFPAIGVSKNTKERNPYHYCCSGSWYLGILEQSLRPKLGYHLIDEITSIDPNLKRYKLGAGLPARKSFYKFHCNENVKNAEGLTYDEVRDTFEEGKKFHRLVCRRESFCGNDVDLYRKTRSRIAEIILKVLEGKKKPENATNEMIKALKQ